MSHQTPIKTWRINQLDYWSKTVTHSVSCKFFKSGITDLRSGRGRRWRGSSSWTLASPVFTQTKNSDFFNIQKCLSIVQSSVGLNLFSSEWNSAFSTFVSLCSCVSVSLLLSGLVVSCSSSQSQSSWNPQLHPPASLTEIPIKDGRGRRVSSWHTT